MEWLIEDIMNPAPYQTKVNLKQDYFSIRNQDREDLIIPYGSVDFIKICNCPLFYDKDSFTFSNFYRHFPSELFLNNQFYILPYQHLFKMRDNLGFLGSEIFIRSDSGDKTYGGEVVSLDSNPTTDEDFLCVVSTTKDIWNEYRFIIYNGKVITGSTYIEKGEIQSRKIETGFVYSFANKVCKHFNNYPVYILDIAEDRMGNFKVIEINSANCSALYKCDIEKFKNSMEKAYREYFE